MLNKKELEKYPNANIAKGSYGVCSSYSNGYCIDSNNSKNEKVLCNGCADINIDNI